MKITTAYFSATYTTRRVVTALAAHLSDEVTALDITNDPALDPITIPSDEMFVVGIPVYAGRVPQMAAERLRRFRGEGTPAVAVAVYGNRHYDDAVLELKDLLSQCGFRVVSAGAFIAQHSIFPKVGAARPDEKDMAVIEDFARRTKAVVEQGFGEISLPGNRPYKQPGGIPIWPTASRRCTACGACVSLCPTGAIDADSPRGVDKEKCIKCGRCIAVCPSRVRRFYGIKYSLAAGRFNAAFVARREPEMWFAESINPPLR